MSESGGRDEKVIPALLLASQPCENHSGKFGGAEVERENLRTPYQLLKSTRLFSQPGFDTPT